MLPGPGLVAHEMQDVTDHSIADGQIRGVRLLCSELEELLRQRQSGAKIASVEMAGPQSPKGPELVVDISVLFRDFEHTRPGGLSFGDEPSRLHQRPGTRSVEAHFMVQVTACSTRSQSAVDTRSTLTGKRQREPERNGCYRECDTRHRIPSRRERPIQRSSHVVD